MSSKTKTTSKSTPWAPAQPFITDSLGQAQNANQAGQAMIGLATPGLNSAISKLTANIDHPPAYMGDAQTQLGKTINGDFLSSNPETAHLADLIAQKTGAQYNSTFGAAGRAHGGLAALLSGQGVGDALSSFYGDQFNRERALQQQAILNAPQFHQLEQGDIDRLLATTQGAALLPGQVAGNYANTVTAATSPYVQNVTTQKTGGLGPILSTALGLAAQVGGAIGTGGASLAAGGLGGLLKDPGSIAPPLNFAGLGALGNTSGYRFLG